MGNMVASVKRGKLTSSYARTTKRSEKGERGMTGKKTIRGAYSAAVANRTSLEKEKKT